MLTVKLVSISNCVYAYNNNDEIIESFTNGRFSIGTNSMLYTYDIVNNLSNNDGTARPYVVARFPIFSTIVLYK